MFGLKSISIFISIILAVFFGIGFYLLFKGVFNVPSNSIRKNTDKLSDVYLKKNSSVDKMLNSFSKLISKYIKLNPSKREKLAQQLDVIEFSLTPEEYYATAIARGLIPVILGLLSLLLNKVLGVGCIITGVLLFYVSINRVTSILKKRRNDIEGELPQFVAMIEQRIKYDRNIQSLIEDYIGDSATPLCRELRIVLADAKTGNLELAINRFVNRIESNYVSDTMRGLISTIQGNDTTSYFETLSIKLREYEVMRIKTIALKRPARTKFLIYAMIASMFIIYIVVFGTIILDSLKTIMK